MVFDAIPATQQTLHDANADLMLVHRLRCWPNIKSRKRSTNVVLMLVHCPQRWPNTRTTMADCFQQAQYIETVLD